MKYYAAYKGEQLLAIGTAKELAEKLGLKRETVYWLSSPSNHKREKKNNRKVVVRLED